MKLTEIIDKIGIQYEILSSNSTREINEILLNSKETGSQSIFCAIKGFKADGHKFIEDCFNQGCHDFIVENSENIPEKIKNRATIVKVNDSRLSLALCSNFINNYPYDKLKMIGVTGTKGKTTVVTLIHHLLKDNFKCGMFSTVKNIVCGIETESERTTMEANKLQLLLKESLECGETHSIVEVSSHAVTLKRIEGINWDIGIFTTFSRDHLDLYGTMENYFEAKLDFFRALNNSTKKNKIAIINIDDPKGEEVCKTINNTIKIIRIGSKQSADYIIEHFGTDENGLFLVFRIKNDIYDISTNILGSYNITNLLIAIVLAHELGINFSTIIKKISKFKGVEGRFDIIINKLFTVIVDYAHTPDSLEKILNEAKKLSKNRVICVFGCTGDRDKEKRQIMGKISAVHADFTVITNDDAYTEGPELIAKAVEEGFLESKKQNYKIILDRKEAIKEAMNIAKKGDVIIIAGMGHEKHQIVNNIAIPYSDKKTVLEIAKKL